MEPIAGASAAPETPAAAQPDPQEQHAAQMLERAIERAEPQEPAAQPRPEAPQRASQPAPAAPQQASSPPVRPVPLFEHPASRGFMSRVQERAAARAQADLAARVERVAQTLEERQGGAPAAAAPDEPDFDADPKGWYQQEMQRQLQQAIAPLVDYVRHQSESEQQYAARVQQEEQQAAWGEAMGGAMDQARELYAATPEGQLFDERFDFWMNDLTVPGLVATGMHPQEAARFASVGVQAWTDYAMRKGINPAIFIDTMIRHQIGATVQMLADAGYVVAGQPQAPQNGNGNGHRRQAPPSPEIAALRETAAGAGSVAGVMRQSGAGRSGSGVHAVMADPSTENIRAWANDEFGGDTRKALAALRRAVASASAQR